MVEVDFVEEHRHFEVFTLPLLRSVKGREVKDEWGPLRE
jgi:hypothetical protein